MLYIPRGLLPEKGDSPYFLEKNCIMLDFSSVISILLPDSQNDVVSMEDANGNILWEGGGGTDYSMKYFFVENKSFVRNALYITPKGSGTPQVTFYTSTDEEHWKEWGTTDFNSAPLQLILDVNERMYIKAYANTFYGSSGNDYITISCDGEYEVGGNIMSLLYGDDFWMPIPSFDPDYDHQFRGLFNSSTTLVKANHLVLPVMELKPYCYQIMFSGCTSLVTPPQLPATTLANYCYGQMFQGCTSLTTAPVLPATTLAYSCYLNMFNGCTSLTTAPALPATTLADYCYQSMFYDCTALTTAPTLPATTLKPSCYSSMFSGCTSLTTTPTTLPATTLANYCYNYMFYGCTALTTAPVLPATTLKPGCYQSMFNGCTSLTTVPSTLPATTLANSCYYGMFQGCSSLTTAPELPAVLLVNGCYRQMFDGCTNLAYIKAMFITTPGNNNTTTNWVNGVSATGTFIHNELANWITFGVDAIPYGWNIDFEPNTLDEGFYFYFEDVSGTSNQISLKKANSSAPTITVSYSTDLYSWVTLSNSSTTARTITLPANGKVYLKCTADRWCSSSNTSYYNNLTTTKNAVVGGNILSLIYGDAYADNTTTKNTYSLCGLLRNNTYLTSAQHLVLPATSLTQGCYSFMLRGCTALTTAPALPATTLANSCYSNMFQGCTSLTTAPVLPATTLVNNCYQSMFASCSSLNYIKAMFTTTPGTSYTTSWVNAVAASGTFVKNSAATWTTTGANGVPSGWTVQTASS